jgi:hypothetical protein
MQKISFIILSILISRITFAAGYVRIDTMYMSESSGQGTSTDISRTLIDFGAGHLFANGFTLGGMYGSEKINANTYTLDRTGIGPTIGYMTSKSKGFYGLATYFFNPTLTGGYKGTGYQLDLGFRFELEKVSIAPQLSKKHFSYDEVNGTPITPPYEEDRIDPYFVIWISY